MIIYEWFVTVCKAILYCICRLPYWLITARDCKHCKNGKINFLLHGDEIYCGKGLEHGHECKNTITRKNFERK